MLDGIEYRLQFRIERRSDPPRDFNRDGARSALDIRIVIVRSDAKGNRDSDERVPKAVIRQL